MKRHGGKLEAVYNIKHVNDNLHGEYQDGCSVLDLERGVVADIRPDPRQTDTCIGNWFYKRGMHYKTPQMIIQILADIVSKNGNLLLNFPLRPDGTLDSEEDRILSEIGNWMAVNSEAIRSTRPWKVSGEGPTKLAGGNFGEQKWKPYTAEDIRFTTKGGNLYAFFFGWPDRRLLIRALNATGVGARDRVSNVDMLGVKQPLKWSRNDQGLLVQMPEQKPGDYTYALRIRT